MSIKKVKLILGTHAHIPLGSKDSEFENIYENKMRPFVTNLYRYSNIQAVLHYSGVLLYWVERNHPEFFMLIEDMVSKKQVEILSGGFYEPMFPLIPLQDRIGQIELLTTYLRKHFRKRPSGCWIPLMAWEQNLVTSLAASDMCYSFLSKNQFLEAGISNDDVFYPCISEDQGKLINIFPVDISLGRDLENKSFSHIFTKFTENINENKNLLNDEEIIISIFPEKTLCSKEEAPDTAWNRFFEEITLSDNIVETATPLKIIKEKKKFKKAAFPNSTIFSNGYSPRRYLIEQSNANDIYSKMIFINVLINQLKGDKSRKQNAREELWKAQDSSLFTPGAAQVNHEIRKAAYSSLLQAEMLSREREKTAVSVITHDFDFDGENECLFQDVRINCYVQLKGASVFELDYLPKAWNYLDCGLEDSKRRTSFTDKILPVQSGKNHEKGSRFICNEKFESLTQSKKGTSCFRLQNTDSAAAYSGIDIVKCYTIKKDTIQVSYSLKNTAGEKMDFIFSTDLFFSFEGENDEHVRFYLSDENGKDTPFGCNIKKNTSILKMLDVKNEVQILLNSINIFSLLLSQKLENDHYQATKMEVSFAIALDPQQTWTNEFSLKFSH